MKCPYRFNIIQKTNREINLEDKEVTVLIENQEFGECFEEECGAWDRKNNKCERK